MADAVSKYEELENELHGVLTDVFKDKVTVELEPEVQGKNTSPFVKSRVTIFLDQSEFSKVRSTHYISQDENTKVFLLVRGRVLRGEYGVYDICNQIRKCLVGFQPKGWDKIWLVKVGFDDRIAEMWHYTVVIATASKIVEEYDEPEIPKLTNPKVEHEDSEFN